jgi:molybdenum cofactor cytidylyltransferase
MGQNKLVLPVGGVPLVRRAAERMLAAGVAPLIVVTGHEPERVHAALSGLAVTFVVNADFTGPTSGSLHAGLRAVPPTADAALILLADMPHVTESMLHAMLQRAATDAAPLVVSRYGDVFAPPLLFRRALFAELLDWHGEGCGKAVVRRHEQAAAVLEWTTAALADVDTPADYQAALHATASDAP